MYIVTQQYSSHHSQVDTDNDALVLLVGIKLGPDQNE